MLLRIIDRLASNNAIEVVFTSNDFKKSFYSQDASKLYAELAPSFLPAKSSSKSVTHFMLNQGKALGEKLDGDDFEMIDITSYIEEAGYENLHVTIESHTPDFFALPWESLILPNSQYVLSAHSRGFTRKVMRDSSHATEQMLTADSLGVVYLQSSHQDNQLDSGNLLGLMCQMAEHQAKTHISIYRSQESFDCLKQQLDNSAQTNHIFHYEGPIFYDNETPYCVFTSKGQDTLVSMGEIATLLEQSEISILSLDITQFDNAPQSESVQHMLSQIALNLNSHYDLHIIANGELISRYEANKNFAQIYLHIASGMALPLAICEARKHCQSQLVSDAAVAGENREFAWLVPCVYSQGTIQINLTSSEEQIAPPSLGNLINQHMHGISSFHLPPFVQPSCDAHLTHAIELLSQSSTPLALTGKQGSGKSHLAHQLALYYCLNKEIEHVFCFDYQKDQYSVEIVYEMLRGVLFDAHKPQSECQKKLAQLHCYFIFDNISQANFSPTQSADFESLIRFLEKTGQKVVIVSPSTTYDKTIELMNWPAHIHKQIIEHKYNTNASDVNIAHLITKSQGNPYVIEQLCKLMLASKQDYDKITKVMEEYTSTGEYDPLEALKLASWHSLTPSLQTFLMLMSEFPSVLCEMIALVIDRCDPEAQERTSAIAQQLFPYNEDPEFSITTELAAMEARGFIMRSFNGHILSDFCAPFIKAQRQHRERSTLQLQNQLIHQLLCQSIAQIIPQVLSNPNQPLTHYLINNRAQWAQSLEHCWLVGNFDAFMSAKQQLDALLGQFKLLDESTLWSERLLAKTPEDYHLKEERAVAWLTLANSTLSRKIEDISVYDSAAKYFEKRVHDPQSYEKQNQYYLYQALAFVESYLFNQAQWQKCFEISQQAYQYFQGKEHLQRSLRCLKVMSICQFKLEQHEKGDVYESEFITLLLSNNEQIPLELRLSLLMEVTESRLARHDYKPALELISATRSRFEHSPAERTLMALEADALFALKQFHDCAQIYSTLFSAIENKDQINQDPVISQRLNAIATEIGSDSFFALFGFNAKDVIQSQVH